MRLISCTLAAVFCAGMATAGDVIPLPPSGVLEETNAFAGINWVFGSGQSRAEGVLGLMRSEVEVNGDAKAVQGSVHVNLTGGLSFGKVKLGVLTGKDDAMAMIGVGFGSAGAFGTAGFWAPYLTGGVDGYFGGGFEPYIGLHSLDELDRPSSSRRLVIIRDAE